MNKKDNICEQSVEELCKQFEHLAQSSSESEYSSDEDVPPVNFKTGLKKWNYYYIQKIDFLCGFDRIVCVWKRLHNSSSWQRYDKHIAGNDNLLVFYSTSFTVGYNLWDRDWKKTYIKVKCEHIGQDNFAELKIKLMNITELKHMRQSLVPSSYSGHNKSSMKNRILLFKK